MTEEDEDIPLTEPADYTECLICSHGIPIIEISKGYDLSSLDNDFCEDSMSADMFSSPVSTAIERIIGSIGNGSKMTLFDSNDYIAYFPVFPSTICDIFFCPTLFGFKNTDSFKHKHLNIIVSIH
eukprot:gnl/Carplike_NY0171/8712_a12110_159.p1 GENE.gnl/Carplike_NY0171/8712_a12110_159~~gnl/Carplike_NY0171/8712_a12110_159.p1  ORF type:complete len:144 (-),score=17.35 gnl/Carplike_NY0171/8712_a12110_159:243-617(-)